MELKTKTILWRKQMDLPPFWKENPIYQMIFCIEQLLFSRIIDIVRPKNELGECLYGNIMMNIQSIERERVSPCCSVMLVPDIVPLQYRYCCFEDWGWWVSVLKDHGEYILDRKRTCLTVFFCNASARCCAPSVLISLSSRLRFVSVCVEISWWI